MKKSIDIILGLFMNFFIFILWVYEINECWVSLTPLAIEIEGRPFSAFFFL